MSITGAANQWVCDLVPYEPGKPIEETARELGLQPEDIIKLASNENPLGPSPKAKKAMQVEIERAHLYPDGGGYLIEHPNYEPADPLKTPELIAPVWYYTPFYSMLRAATFPLFGLDAKLWGLIVMAGAIVLPFVLPWLDKSPVKSMRYKGLGSKIMLGLFVISFFILGYLGTVHPTPGRTVMAQVCTGIYFAYFLLMPWYTAVEKTKLVPERVTM